MIDSLIAMRPSCNEHRASSWSGLGISRWARTKSCHLLNAYGSRDNPWPDWVRGKAQQIRAQQGLQAHLFDNGRYVQDLDVRTSE